MSVISTSFKLEDGTYLGLWSGFKIVLENGCEIKTSIGIKGIDIKTQVIVDGDDISYDVLKPEKPIVSNIERLKSIEQSLLQNLVDTNVMLQKIQTEIKKELESL